MQKKLHNENIVDDNNLVPMGRIIGAFGIKGWVKIKADTHENDALIQYESLYLSIGGKNSLYKIENSFVQNDVLHVKFEEISDRDVAMGLKGVVVSVSRESFPATHDDEYYWVDLMGLSVSNVTGDYFGVVIDMMETGANSVLVVKNEDTERLIPFVGVYISDVDLKQKKITVNWELDY